MTVSARAVHFDRPSQIQGLLLRFGKYDGTATMRGLAKSALVCTILGIAASGVAMADEMMVPLVVSGDWAALAHRPTMLAAPDACMVGNFGKGLAFRADSETIELRMMDKKWSLPADIQGSIVVSVGAWKATLEIDSNTSNLVAAVIERDALGPMFAAMDKASSMTVTVGKAPPTVISLAGSTRATDAFRTCAGINSNSKTPGSNPVE